MFSNCKNQQALNREIQVDNEDLVRMVLEDQEIRNKDDADFEPLDKTHRNKVFELLANGLVTTNKDKLNAALILQHTALVFCNDELNSISAENYLLAYHLSKSAFENGELSAANFVAVTLDRYLLYTVGYQKYGTQRVFDDETNEEMWAPIDSLTTDEERRKYGVPSKDSLLLRFKIKQI